MKAAIPVSNPRDLAASAEAAARLLTALAHAKRLLALCHLLRAECPVGQLALLVGLTPTALSQHLARLRDLGLVATRREGQANFYRLASAEVAAILRTLHGLYGAPGADAGDGAALDPPSATVMIGTTKKPEETP